jgi:catechol 2,3-dioxygenase-like lactoylglutathione lyase family enzyme
MLRGIDHLVIAVRDLEAAVLSYEALGFLVTPGGRHPVATHNALIAFPDGAYVELLAFYDPAPTHRWWMPLERGGGLVDFCAQTDDLAADLAAFRAAGVEMEAGVPGARTRPDGYQVRWTLAVPRTPGVVPFLIQDDTPRHERVPRRTAHPNQIIGIGTVTVATSDLPGTRACYASALGQAGEEVDRPDLEAAGAAFRMGPHTVEVLGARDGRGRLGEWIGRHGPSPYAATFVTRRGRRGALDPALTLGARLAVA